MKHRIVVIALGLCSLLAAAPAHAQLGRAGETFGVWGDFTRGSAVAYDTRNNVYLVVAAHGRVDGRFVSPDGAPLGEVVVFQERVLFGQFPHIAYSPDANNGNGAFLVTWHESDAGNGPPSLHLRMISYTGGFLTPEKIIIGNDTHHEIYGAPVAYSTVSREFFVVWRQYSDTNIWGLHLNLNGDPTGNPIAVATTPQFESDHSLAYNPTTDEYLVVYRRGFSPTGVMAQRVKAGPTGPVLGAPSLLTQVSTANATGVAFNPSTGQYLATWHQDPGNFVAGRVVAADGTPIGNVAPLSTRFGTYDSLSVEANPISGTVLLAGHDHLSVEDGGVEIDSAGNPLTGGEVLTASGGNGNFYPKVASNPTRREWLLVTARSQAAVFGQRVSTTRSGGPGPGPAPAPAPAPPPAPATRLFVDQPLSGGGSTGRLVISGWTVDTAAASGTGVDAVHVWAFPVGGGAPQFVGAATTGIPRPDVAAYLGSARFANSGYQLIGRMAPGTYDVGVYAHSTVANAFNTVRLLRVIIISPASDPQMAVDLPTVNQTFSSAQSIVISGWAADLWATSGWGVDAVHVWAYPIVGGGYAAPVFVGAATLGVSRGDVAAAFGMPQLAPSGYVLFGRLTPGSYDLVVYARSTEANAFNNWRVVRVHVN